ncbi:MAG: LemA family protein [Actinomycetes bacterium]|nr:LemA family protein [Actinomycetes bacterium]
MGTGGVIAVIVIAVILLIVAWVIGTYNRLVGLRGRVDNAWAQIAVQLKRRWDLIPNLVETVKGYAAHEKSALEGVIAARNGAVSAAGAGVEASAQAENVLTGALRQLFAVAEAYPELKANQNFLQLQSELTQTEDKISFTRQFYNDTVMTYNITIQRIPTVIIAGMFHFTARKSFEVDETESQAPKVQF